MNDFLKSEKREKWLGVCISSCDICESIFGVKFFFSHLIHHVCVCVTVELTLDWQSGDFWVLNSSHWRSILYFALSATNFTPFAIALIQSLRNSRRETKESFSCAKRFSPIPICHIVSFIIFDFDHLFELRATSESSAFLFFFVLYVSQNGV